MQKQNSYILQHHSSTVQISDNVGAYERGKIPVQELEVKEGRGLFSKGAYSWENAVLLWNVIYTP